MKGIQDVLTGIKAGYPYFYCRSHEVLRHAEAIAEAISSEECGIDEVKTWNFADNADADWVVETLKATKDCAIIAQSWHWFLSDPAEGIDKDKVSFLMTNGNFFSSPDCRNVLIIVGSEEFGNAIPESLQRDFLPIDMELPTEAELKQILDTIIESVEDSEKFKKPTKQEEVKAIQCMRGLTALEAKNALAFSLVQTEGRIDASIINQIRAKEIEKTAGLRTSQSRLTFDSLKGYEVLKQFTKATIRSPIAKGIILLGPAGVGKTHFARCLAAESGLEMYELEFAEMPGQLQGQMESRIKKVIEVVRANAPCLLFVDEIEKALSGVGKGSASTDGGTSDRAAAQFLKFLSDPRDGIYVVATCNNISQLPPEWVRAERWDCAPWYIPLPSKEEKKEILAYYKEEYNVKGNPLDMDGWSGAEIKACCRIAAMMEKTVPEAEQFIIPVSKTMEKQIAALEKWAEGKALRATNITMKPERKSQKRKVQI